MTSALDALVFDKVCVCDQSSLTNRAPQRAHYYLHETY